MNVCRSCVITNANQREIGDGTPRHNLPSLNHLKSMQGGNKPRIRTCEQGGTRRTAHIRIGGQSPLRKKVGIGKKGIGGGKNEGQWEGEVKMQNRSEHGDKQKLEGRGKKKTDHQERKTPKTRWGGKRHDLGKGRASGQEKRLR